MPAPHTADRRWIVVGGRRWRATDPAIPEHLRDELVRQLMEARRRVAHGKRRVDSRAVRRARRAVHDAKVALGERGEPWWEPTPAGQSARAVATRRALRRGRRRLAIPDDDVDAVIRDPSHHGDVHDVAVEETPA